MRRRVKLPAVVAAVMALAGFAPAGIVPAGFAPAVAIASSGSGALAAQAGAILKDCQANGQLTHTYTKAALDEALRVMSPTVRQYSNCYDVIQGALSGAAGHIGGGGGGSGGSFLPTPVIVILVLLVLGGVTFGALAVRRRQGERGTDGDQDGDGGL